ncbi:acyl carrier protein (plasmid) [Streptomyces californicus]|uniref:Acyl carrier protein n=1 Tax=Streptomyces californicus TaxID=67351 RepID=A0ABD7DBX0_9ACTN|nr:acyl carrier protein [Streptomyces californicus]QRV39113.1 acyl carrier protein [Streptomyces californicus]QRV52566.1 acyl carrier protein [Streptomyces californicus]
MSRGPAETNDEITRFLTDSLRREVGPDDDYFALGLVDSLFALELVTYVEERFKLTVEVDDLDLDSFRTARRLTAFVHAKEAAAETASFHAGDS